MRACHPMWMSSGTNNPTMFLMSKKLTELHIAEAGFEVLVYYHNK